MSAHPNRSYNCKDEELPVICRFSAISWNRDLADFTAYSPRLGEAALAGYEAEIAKVEALFSPASETAEMKKMTARIHDSMNVLLDYTNQLRGYLEMAGSSIHLTAVDFGLSPLRKGINHADPEKVIDSLKEVINNVIRYKTELAEQGFTDTLQAKLEEVYTSLNTDRQLQYQILIRRKALVQGNIIGLNNLYERLAEVLRTGKILYQGKDALKQQEYTFAELLKQVRRVPQKEAAVSETQGLPGKR